MFIFSQPAPFLQNGPLGNPQLGGWSGGGEWTERQQSLTFLLFAEPEKYIVFPSCIPVSDNPLLEEGRASILLLLKSVYLTYASSRVFERKSYF